MAICEKCGESNETKDGATHTCTEWLLTPAEGDDYECEGLTKLQMLHMLQRELKPRRRFMAFHESEVGFDSPAACQDWIDTNPESCNQPKNWRVAEIIIDPVTDKFCNGELADEKEKSYIQGMEMARKLLRLQLGLAVPGDSNG